MIAGNSLSQVVAHKRPKSHKLWRYLQHGPCNSELWCSHFFLTITFCSEYASFAVSLYEATIFPILFDLNGTLPLSLGVTGSKPWTWICWIWKTHLAVFPVQRASEHMIPDEFGSGLMCIGPVSANFHHPLKNKTNWDSCISEILDFYWFQVNTPDYNNQRLQDIQK